MICLLPHCGFLSETSRMLAIYKALRARGADVCMATHGGTHESFLREAGVPYHLLEPRVSAERCARLVESATAAESMNPSFHTEDEIRAEVHAQDRFFREHGIRMAVTGFTLSTLLSTRLVGIPLATSYGGSFVPPVFERGIAPAPSRPAPLFRMFPKWMLRSMSNWMVPRIKIYCGEFNRVAKELGVPGIPSFAAMFLGDLTLVTEIPEVLGIPREELENWRPKLPHAYRANCQLRYTGPIFAKLDLPIPERVESFLNRDGRALVYVAMTSSPAVLVAGVVAALRATGARILVASTVHSLEGCGGDDVLVERYLPSHRIMPRVDLAVIAGGQGSVQSAMASGTPMVGVPLQGEQDLNVHLAERLGMGRLVSMREATGPRMTEAARQLLTDARARESAARLRDLYAQVDGPATAADAILEYLGASVGASASSRRSTHLPPGQLSAIATLRAALAPS